MQSKQEEFLHDFQVAYYRNKSESFTHLRYNKAENRIETTKGVQIPVEIAKRAYIALNTCLTQKCDNINVPVMQYAITQTTGKSIIAGCHNIPVEDVNYISKLLNW